MTDILDTSNKTAQTGTGSGASGSDTWGEIKDWVYDFFHTPEGKIDGQAVLKVGLGAMLVNWAFGLLNSDSFFDKIIGLAAFAFLILAATTMSGANSLFGDGNRGNGSGIGGVITAGDTASAQQVNHSQTNGLGGVIDVSQTPDVAAARQAAMANGVLHDTSNASTLLPVVKTQAVVERQ